MISLNQVLPPIVVIFINLLDTAILICQEVTVLRCIHHNLFSVLNFKCNLPAMDAPGFFLEIF
jgi:hypothetical protein